jgi:sugar phosphate permease
MKCSATIPEATIASVFPPIMGSISSILMGVVSDKLNQDTRNLFLLGFNILMFILSLSLYLITIFIDEVNMYLAVVIFSLINFSLNGPYSLPAAAMSIEFGGKKVTATLSGLFDGFGMIGTCFFNIIKVLYLVD